jgi:hypothetical protein
MVSDLLKSNFIQNDASKAWFLSLLTLAVLAVMNLIVRLSLKGNPNFGSKEVMILFLSVWGTYIIWSYLITGLLMGNFRSEQPLYVINLLVFMLLIKKSESPFADATKATLFPKDRWTIYFISVIAFIVVLSLIVHLMNGDFPNVKLRFPLQP